MAILTSSLMEHAGQSGSLLSRPARSWKWALAASGTILCALVFVGAALTTEAQAARCPSGQFWRVSKKICQDKSVGVKHGFFNSEKSQKTDPTARSPTTKPSTTIKSSKKILIAAPLDLTTLTRVKKCAANQFWRVSKKMCQDKSIGIKLGIFKLEESKQPTHKATLSNTKSVSALKTITKGSEKNHRSIEISISSSHNNLKSIDNKNAISTSKGESTLVKIPTQDNFNTETSNSPLNAISTATRLDTSPLKEKPLETRMVKATYFTLTTSQLGAQSATTNTETETSRRAVLNLLKSHLQKHAERNRDHIIRRAMSQ